MLAEVLQELTAYSIIELVAVGLAVCYLLLAARNNRYCWYAAFVSSALFVVVLWNVQLFMDAALNFYYVVMAVYGWLCWNAKSVKGTQLESGIRQYSLRFNSVAVLLIVILSVVSGYLLSRYTEAAFPYLDSLTTWGALFATWLLARRAIENWLYWIVLNSISVYLYWHKDLHFTMVLFVFYVVMSIYAYLYWRQSARLSYANVAV